MGILGQWPYWADGEAGPSPWTLLCARAVLEMGVHRCLKTAMIFVLMKLTNSKTRSLPSRNSWAVEKTDMYASHWNRAKFSTMATWAAEGREWASLPGHSSGSEEASHRSLPTATLLNSGKVRSLTRVSQLFVQWFSLFVFLYAPSGTQKSGKMRTLRKSWGSTCVISEEALFTFCGFSAVLLSKMNALVTPNIISEAPVQKTNTFYKNAVTESRHWSQNLFP